MYAPYALYAGPKKTSAILSRSWSQIARYTITALPCAAVPLLGAALAYFVISSSFYVSHVTDSTTIVEKDAALVCSSVACREVAAFLALITDHNVAPCDDFYRHVCGKWPNATTSSRSEAESSQHSSYEEVNRRTFLARVHRTLAHLAYSPNLCSPRDCSMVRFHDSCVHFASRHAELQSRPSMHTILEEAGINTSTWQRAATLKDLLENAVGSCLRTGLTMALNVRHTENGDIFVDVGESLVHTLQDDQHNDLRTKHFVNESLADLRQHGSGNDSLEAILIFDSRIESTRKAVNNSEFNFRVVRASDLPSPLSDLLSFANRYGANKPQHTPTASVHERWSLQVRALENVYSIITILGSVQLSLAAIYLLLVAASQVLKYAYLLQPTQSPNNDYVVAETCVRATATHFPHRFPFWLASTMETPEARFYLNAMVTALRMSATDTPYVAKSITVNGSDFTAMPVETLAAAADAFEDTEAASLPEDFLRSVIQLSRKPLANDWLEARSATQLQLRGDVGQGVTGDAVTVPSLFLTADLLHTEASEDSLDYSTVGVRMLVKWANTAALGSETSASSESLATHRRCIADHADKQGVSEHALSSILFLPWALEVALTAATRGTFAQRLLAAKRRLFFRRFCLTSCGDAQAADVCRYGVRHSEAFARAFECSGPAQRLPC